MRLNAFKNYSKGKWALTRAVLLFGLLFEINPYEVTSYTIKKGDQLGRLLYERGYGGLWGPDGFVTEIAKLNNLKDLSLKVGQKIKLPEKYASKLISRSPNSDSPPHLESQKFLVKYPKKKSFKEKALISIIQKVFYGNIKMTDPNNGKVTNLNSKTSSGLELKWRQVWTEETQTFVFINTNHYSFQAPNNRKMVSRKNTLIATGIGLRNKWLNRIWTIISGQFGGELYIVAPSTERIRIEKTIVPSAKIAVEAQLLKLPKFELSALVGARYLAKTDIGNYRSKESLGREAGINIKQKSKNYNILGAFKFEENDKNTNNLLQTHKNIAVSVGFSWDF